MRKINVVEKVEQKHILQENSMFCINNCFHL